MRSTRTKQHSRWALSLGLIATGLIAVLSFVHEASAQDMDPRLAQNPGGSPRYENVEALVVPGKPTISLLFRHVIGLESPRVPFDGPPYLDQESIDLLRRWIEDGARDNNGMLAPMPNGGFVKLRGHLTGRWAIDGQAFDIAPGARIRDAVVGGRIEIRGNVQADGRILATRVRGR